MQVKSITAKKILTEMKGDSSVGFTHSLNPYSGCAFGCRYCYVREMPIQRYSDTPWGEWVSIKTNAADNYRNEMINLCRRNKPINLFLSTATDPYQPLERKTQLTRSIIEEMIKHPPNFLQIQTRSPLVVRDLDLLLELNQKCEVLVSMTIETDREDMKRLFAPHAPGIKLRLKALKEVNNVTLKQKSRYNSDFERNSVLVPRQNHVCSLSEDKNLYLLLSPPSCLMDNK